MNSLSPTFVLDGVAIVVYTAFALVIAIRDVRHHLVRNGDVLFGIAGLLIVFGLELIWGFDWLRFAVSLGGGAVNWGVYRLIRVIVPRQLGAGDPGVAALAGLFLGHWGVTAALLGLVVPYAASAIPAILLWATSGAKTRMAFAPFLVLTVPVSLLVASLV